jgi:hypothetical protein
MAQVLADAKNSSSETMLKTQHKIIREQCVAIFKSKAVG